MARSAAYATGMENDVGAEPSRRGTACGIIEGRPVTTEPTIRPATLDDAPAMLALVAAYWAFEGLAGFDADALRAPLARLITTPELGAVWVAAEGHRPIGYLTLVYVFSLEHRGMTAEVDELFIAPEHRGAGLGDTLLRAAEAEAVLRGCTNLSLQVSTANRRARALYARNGFSPRRGFELLEKDLPGAAADNDT